MPRKLVSTKFECWEIAFHDDPDGEKTRGITRRQAVVMMMRGLIVPQHEGVVLNMYHEPVYAHTYVPTPGNEEAVWQAWLNEEYDD